MDYNNLVKKAREAQEHAYSPYSKIKVGAALLTKAGKIFTGCNVENASYGATVCAERTAICKAVSEGERDFAAIAITSNQPTITPCGICRQTLIEFSPQMDIVFLDKENKMIIYKAVDLLPESFNLNN